VRTRVALACLFLCACAKRDAGGEDDGASHARESAPSVATSTETADASDARADRPPVAEADAGPDLTVFQTRAPVWGKSIGHTSVVFKLKLEGGAQAAYKPHSHRGAARYKGEIAAYRLARALGLSNVPPALPRSFAWTELYAALGGEATEAGKLLKEETVGDAHGNVPGAIIPWIDHLTFVPLDAEPARSSWRGWLATKGSVPEDKKKLAGQISTMIVFDYLTGNWDRWSGGNIGMQEGGQMLLFIDNDGAFFDPPPPGPLASQLGLLKDDAKLSRSFVDALRSLDLDAARAAMGELGPGEPLLSTHVLAGFETRRKAALAIIAARVAADGEDKVLVFE
jgi:hypothetical protein